MKERVLILCTGNSARSQMAEGLLNHGTAERFDVESAGTKYALDQIHLGYRVRIVGDAVRSSVQPSA